MGWLDTVKTLAPTVASALGGPLAGGVVELIGAAFGIEQPTQDKIKAIIEKGQMTSEHLFQLKEIELKLQAEESERNFRFADLEVRDREGARRASVDGGTMNKLFWFSIWLISTVLISELCVLYFGLPHGIPEIIIGRILGLLDSIAIQVLNFWFGTSSGSVRKTDIMAREK